MILIFQLSNHSWAQSPGWMRPFKRITAGDLEDTSANNPVTPQRLIDEGGAGAAQERYHDEADDGQVVGLESNNGNRPRVEPSGLVTGNDGEQWRGDVESSREGLEAITGLIPEILERLPRETITLAHQNKVKYYIAQLSKVTGQHPATIYSSLYTAFDVPRYQELLEAEWDAVEQWFKVKLERGGQKRER